MAEYQAEFEGLMNKVDGMPDELLISMFISGLYEDIQRELLMSWPSQLTEVFALAQMLESRFANTMAMTRSSNKWSQKTSQATNPTRAATIILHQPKEAPPQV